MFVLGIMKAKDLAIKGVHPMYILCRARSPSENRTEYTMQAYKDWLFQEYTSHGYETNVRPVFFRDPEGHEELIDYMSRTRTSETREFPRGVLSWVFLNNRGAFTTVIPIRWTPSSYHRTEFDGKEVIENYRERHRPTLQKLVSEDEWCIDFPFYVKFGSGRPAVPTNRNKPKKPKKEKKQ